MERGKRCVLIVFFLVMFCGYSTVFSQEKSAKQNLNLSIGYIDIQEILSSHPMAAPSLEELRKFQMERQKDIDEKIKGRELSPEEREKISDLARKYEQEIAEKDTELTLKIIQDIKSATERVAKRLNIQIVFDAQAVVYGGIDITQDVMKEITKQ